MADVSETHPRCRVECAACGETVPGQVRRNQRTGERDGFYVFKHGNPTCLRGQYRTDHRLVPDEEEMSDASDGALMGS